MTFLSERLRDILLSNVGLTYQDILLVPKFSTIESRSAPSLLQKFNKTSLSLPIVSSPMDTITDATMAYAMHKAGGFGIIHRACSINEQVFQVTHLKRLLNYKELAPSETIIAAATGVAGDFQERIQALVKAGVNTLCFDTSHGHNKLMEDAVKWTKQHFPEIYIIAGSIATAEAYRFMLSLEVDAVRVGIGNGSICSTRMNTGFGVPQVTALARIANTRNHYTTRARQASTGKAPPLIIADGGCRYPGDIVKALALGADLVMLGSMLAGTSETPGEAFEDLMGVGVRTTEGWLQSRRRRPLKRYQHQSRESRQQFRLRVPCATY